MWMHKCLYIYIYKIYRIYKILFRFHTFVRCTIMSWAIAFVKPFATPFETILHNTFPTAVRNILRTTVRARWRRAVAPVAAPLWHCEIYGRIGSNIIHIYVLTNMWMHKYLYIYIYIYTYIYIHMHVHLYLIFILSYDVQLCRGPSPS